MTWYINVAQPLKTHLKTRAWFAATLRPRLVDFVFVYWILQLQFISFSCNSEDSSNMAQKRVIPGPIDSPAGRLAAANLGFSLDLYRELGKSDANRNLFFSPGSISVAMAMTYMGARGNTADEMKKVLNFAEIPDDTLHGSFNELLAAYQKADSVTLHMANKLYTEQSYDIVQQYLEDSKKFYNAELAKVNFVGNADGARVEINKWVEEQTQKKIKDILPSGSVDNLTRAVLVNAIYFKGDWNMKFDPAKTEPAEFTTLPGEKIPIQMMFQKKKFSYGVNHALHTQAVELPYAGNTMSMIILLPSPGKYEHFVENLKLEDLLQCEKSFRLVNSDVHVWLPRFRLEDSFSLGDTLSDMGMKELFSETGANLSGIDASNKLYVSKVLHKAFLEVNEEGSEAAAATAVVMQMRMMPREFHFKANTPFMFFIRENTTRSILFMGRMMKPDPEGAAKQEL